MDIAKYMAVIPGILYGMALVELIKIYRHKSRYWETNLLGFLLFITIIYDKYKTFPYMNELFSNMAVFTLYLIGPFVFMHMCYTLTPENEDDEAEEHFLGIRKKFFYMLAIFTSFNIFIELLFINDGLIYLRFLGVALYTLNGYFNWKWLRIITYSIIFFAVYLLYYPSVMQLIN